MRRTEIGFVGLLLLAAMAACGGDDATTTTSTTEAAATTAAPAETTTSAAATTTTPTTTTTAPDPDAHVAVPNAWEEFWPADGSVATYRATTFEGVTAEVEARLDYGVEWNDGTWDRFTLGSTEDVDGYAVYLDREVPWVVRIGGIERYYAASQDGPDETELYAQTPVFDMSGGVGDTVEVGTKLQIVFSGGTVDLDLEYTATIVEVDASLQTEFGELTGVVVVEASVGWGDDEEGPRVGRAWIHPGQFLVRIAGVPGFNDVELIEPWH